MADVEHDYYELLGVPRDADPKTIKDAYHRLAMKWHPDRNSSPDAEAQFKAIAKAYAILSDPKKRARYDAQGFEGVAHYSHDDLYSNLDLGSLFGDLGFGFGPGGESIFERLFHRARPQPHRGENLHIDLQLPLERIATGGAETVHYSRPRPCSDCHGYGTADGNPPAPCSACGGSGHRVLHSEQKQQGDRIAHFQQITTCPVCQGRGQQVTEPCQRCGGHGQLHAMESLKLQIPAGIHEGSRLRVEGHGHPAASPTSPPGDLYVTIYSSPDPRFQRRGADLWRSETVQLDELVLGTKRQIPTLEGEVTVTIPKGTQPDAVLRLRGKGLPRFPEGSQGDLNLRIVLQIPQSLSDEERGLFEQLRRLRLGRG